MNSTNKRLSINDIATMSQEEIIQYYRQGYELEHANYDPITNSIYPTYPTYPIQELSDTIPGGTVGKIVLIGGMLILGYLLLVAKYKIEGSAAKMAGQKYIATSSGSRF